MRALIAPPVSRNKPHTPPSWSRDFLRDFTRRNGLDGDHSDVFYLDISDFEKSLLFHMTTNRFCFGSVCTPQSLPFFSSLSCASFGIFFFFLITCGRVF